MCLWGTYIFPRSICLFCCRKYVDRSWEYTNRSQTHECRNRDWGRAIPRKEYINGIFVAVVWEGLQLLLSHHAGLNRPGRGDTALSVSFFSVVKRNVSFWIVNTVIRLVSNSAKIWHLHWRQGRQLKNWDYLKNVSDFNEKRTLYLVT